jgi:hypothetical protein
MSRRRVSPGRVQLENRLMFIDSVSRLELEEWAGQWGTGHPPRGIGPTMLELIERRLAELKRREDDERALGLELDAELRGGVS